MTAYSEAITEDVLVHVARVWCRSADSADIKDIPCGAFEAMVRTAPTTALSNHELAKHVSPRTLAQLVAVDRPPHTVCTAILRSHSMWRRLPPHGRRDVVTKRPVLALTYYCDESLMLTDEELSLAAMLAPDVQEACVTPHLTGSLQDATAAQRKVTQGAGLPPVTYNEREARLTQ